MPFAHLNNEFTRTARDVQNAPVRGKIVDLSQQLALRQT